MDDYRRSLQYSLEKVLDGSSPKTICIQESSCQGYRIWYRISIPESASGILIERSRRMLEATLGGHLAGMMNDKLALAYALQLDVEFLFSFSSSDFVRSISTQYFEKTPVSKDCSEMCLQ